MLELDPEQLLHYPSTGQSFSRQFNDAYEQAQQVCLTSAYVKELYIVQFRDTAKQLHFTFAPASQISRFDPIRKGSMDVYKLKDICAVVRMK